VSTYHDAVAAFEAVIVAAEADLRSQLATATAHAADLGAQVERLAAEVTTLGTALAERDRTIVELRDRIAELEAGEPDPEPARRMLIGAAMGIKSRGEAYVDRYDVECGPLGCTREYDGGLTGTAGTQRGVRHNVTRGRQTVLSVKPGGESNATYEAIARGEWDARIQAYLDGWPAGMGGWFLIGNEPDQNKKNIDPAPFCAAVEHLAAVLTMPPGVRLGVALMEWSWHAKNPRRLGAQWFPDVDSLHVEIHGYGRDTYPAPDAMFGEFLADLPARYTWGLGETNAFEDASNPDRKGRWLTALADWCQENGAEYFCMFDVLTGADAEHHISRSSPQTTAAVKQIAVKHASDV
jgi:hypothetical protein